MLAPHRNIGMLPDQEIEHRLASTVFQAQKRPMACISACFFAMQLVLTTHVGTWECWLIKR